MKVCGRPADMPRAPKTCSTPGCTALTHNGSRCAAHPRRSGRFQQRPGTPRTATTEWKKLRAAVLRRDPMCQIRRPGICQGASVIADHIKCRAAGGNNDMSNLRGACRPCSDWHTSQEGHYLAGHQVPQPWPDSDTTSIVRQSSPSQPQDDDIKAFVPRTIWIGPRTQ